MDDMSLRPRPGETAQDTVNRVIDAARDSTWASQEEIERQDDERFPPFNPDDADDLDDDDDIPWDAVDE